MTDVVPESASLARLRNAWLESIHVPDGAACLAPDWIWDAVTGQQAPAELETGLAHVTQCAVCAEAWRVAHELVVITGLAPTAHRPAPAWRAWRVWLPAAAALVVLLAGIGGDRGWFESQTAGGADADVVRGAPVTLTSTLAEPQTCERVACRLTWSDAGPGARYTVRVTRADLEPVTLANGLSDRAYTIPAATLVALEPNTEVLWQVEAGLPDGRRVLSATFVLAVR